MFISYEFFRKGRPHRIFSEDIAVITSERPPIGTQQCLSTFKPLSSPSEAASRVRATSQSGVYIHGMPSSLEQSVSNLMTGRVLTLLRGVDPSVVLYDCRAVRTDFYFGLRHVVRSSLIACKGNCAAAALPKDWTPPFRRNIDPCAEQYLHYLHVANCRCCTHPRSFESAPRSTSN